MAFTQVLQTGRLLIEARDAWPGEFEAMVANDLPFGKHTAYRLMDVRGFILGAQELFDEVRGKL
jgi:hypothetical protein